MCIRDSSAAVFWGSSGVRQKTYQPVGSVVAPLPYSGVLGVLGDPQQPVGGVGAILPVAAKDSDCQRVADEPDQAEQTYHVDVEDDPLPRAIWTSMLSPSTGCVESVFGGIFDF